MLRGGVIRGGRSACRELVRDGGVASPGGTGQGGRRRQIGVAVPPLTSGEFCLAVLLVADLVHSAVIVSELGGGHQLRECPHAP